MIDTGPGVESSIAIGMKPCFIERVYVRFSLFSGTPYNII